MYKKFNLCFFLIAVSIAGNGMARYLLVDVAEEKRISDKGAGNLLTECDYGSSKLEIIHKFINSKLNVSYSTYKNPYHQIDIIY